ncbi:hypothetical protein NBRC116188_01030 [Oceaniserpentilla sp. 4NH20-0058]|uniref:carboxylesterase/lipase family protein n=1 Tax=Oceaniserpentilla sp. 4NH20-0058 TaxID=3127660 RepID=UPI0031028F94
MKTFQKLKSAASYIGCAALTLALVGCNLEAETEQGTYQGVETDGIISFKGIKYATAERFEAPTAAPSFTDIQLADTAGSPCPQVGGSFGTSSVNEDCLFLNIDRPALGKNRPVMVWIHGGAFITGSGDTYDTSRLVEQGVVVVTINYRLGALGFLTHPALSEATGTGSGNYGLMDQQFALQWIQDNIEAFGGNPDNVTIFGESAGGHSVMDQLTIPTSQGLYSKAIVQSGTYHLEEVPLEVAEGLGQLLVANSNCATSTDMLNCLKTLPVEDMLAAQGSDQFLPTTGTAFHPYSPLVATYTGQLADVPLMSGSNKDEGTLFTALAQVNAYEAAIQEAATAAYLAELAQSGDPVAAAAAAEAAGTAASQGSAFYAAAAVISSQATYDAAVTTLLAPFPYTLNGHTIAEVADEYLAGTTDYYGAYNRLQTDWRFACTALNTANTLKANPYRSSDIFAYHFTDQNAPNLFAPYFPIGFAAGASHAAEIPYVLSDGSGFEGNEDQAALSAAMIKYWTTFAKTGNPNPNHSQLVQWPAFSAVENNMLELGTGDNFKVLAEADFNNTHNCGYWNIPTQ